MTRQFIKFEDEILYHYDPETKKSETQFITAFEKVNEWLRKTDMYIVKWQFFQQTIQAQEQTYDTIVIEYEV